MKSLLLGAALLSTCGLDVSPQDTPPAAGVPGPTVSFGLEILPLFHQDCIICHGGAGGLALESYDALVTGGFSGPIVVPFDPDASLLVQRLEGSVPPRMPINGPPFPGAEIARVRTWIAEGALDN